MTTRDQREESGATSSAEASLEATALLEMAQNMRDALAERDELIRPHREWYERLHSDLRVAAGKRVKAAAELLQAAYRADHVYGERIGDGVERYRRLTSGENESRY
jgi:hypothetical protein